MAEKSVKESDKSAAINHRKIIIIGGKGQLGRLFVQQFKNSGYKVQVIDKNDWYKAHQILQNAALVLVAVPINITEQIIEKLGNLPSDCILADITSIKEKPLDAMLKNHAGPVVGLHPMFGPDVVDFHEQTIIVCEGKQADKYQWFIKQLAGWRAKLIHIDSKNHDKAMGMIQVMRHFSTVAYGYHLMSEKTDLSEIMQLSSPIYRLELAMVGRLFAQDPALYTDIIFSDPDNIETMERYIKRFELLLDVLKSGDKKEFIRIFSKVSNWFGDHATDFLEESSKMLQNNHEILSGKNNK